MSSPPSANAFVALNTDEHASEKIQVAVRVRKALDRELKAGQPSLWTYAENKIWAKSGDAGRPFAYDRVFPPSADNEDVHEGLVKNIIESVLQGYNATIFAYGQTASGKTHTMLGTDTDEGVTMRSIDQIFDSIASLQKDESRNFLIRVSYIEIYNETLSDLLVDPAQRTKLMMREDAHGLIVIDNLTETPVSCKQDIFDLMGMGEKNRHYGETNMNERSSRSHTIFRLTLESSAIETVAEEENIVQDGNGIAVTVSQLNLVDLAGSERASQTGAVGQRLKEGNNINKSLMVLSQVISKLSEGSAEHIPYRNSKLTRLLKNSLGGNALTAMICTVSPVEGTQTRSTLEFASRVKKIIQHAQKNEILDDRAHLARMQKEMKELQQALQREISEKKELDEEKRELRRMLEIQYCLVFPPVDATKAGTSAPSKADEIRRRKSWHPSLAKRVSMGYALQPLQPLRPFRFNNLVASEEVRFQESPSSPVQENFMDANASEVQNLFSAGEVSRLNSILHCSPSINALDLSSSPAMVNTRRRKRTVRFCDTDSFSMPTTPNHCEGMTAVSPVFGTPATSETPRLVLKDRLSKTRQELQKVNQEFHELKEFTRLENNMHEESQKTTEIEMTKAENERLREQLSFLEEKLVEYEAIRKEDRKLRDELDVIKQNQRSIAPSECEHLTTEEENTKLAAVHLDEALKVIATHVACLEEELLIQKEATFMEFLVMKKEQQDMNEFSAEDKKEILSLHQQLNAAKEKLVANEEEGGILQEKYEASQKKLEEELLAIRKEQEDMRENSAKDRKENLLLHQQLNAAKEKLVANEEEGGILQEKYEASQKKLEEAFQAIKKEQEDMRENSAKDRKENFSLHQQLNAAKEKLVANKEEGGILQEKYETSQKKLEEAFQAIKKEQEDMRENSAEDKKEILSLHQQLNAAKEKLEANQEEGGILQKKYEASQKKLEEAFQAIKKEQEDMRENSAEDKKEILSLHQQLNAAKGKLVANKEEGGILQEKYEASQKKLEEAFQAIKKEQEDMNEQSAEDKKEILSLHQQLNAAKGKLVANEEEVGILQEKYEASQKKLEEAFQAIKKEQEDMNEQSAEDKKEILSLHQQLNAAKGKLVANEEEVGILQEKYEASQKKLEEAFQAIKKEQEYMRENSAKDGKEILSLHQQLNAAKEKLVANEEEVGILQEKYEASQKKLEEAFQAIKKEQEDMRENSAKDGKEILCLHQQFNAAKEKLVSSKEEGGILLEKYEALKGEYMRIKPLMPQNGIATTVVLNQKVQGQDVEQKKLVEGSQKKLEEEFQALKREQEDMNEHSAENKKEILSLHRQLNAAKEKLVANKEEGGILQEKYEALIVLNQKVQCQDVERKKLVEASQKKLEEEFQTLKKQQEDMSENSAKDRKAILSLHQQLNAAKEKLVTNEEEGGIMQEKYEALKGEYMRIKLLIPQNDIATTIVLNQKVQGQDVEQEKPIEVSQKKLEHFQKELQYERDQSRSLKEKLRRLQNEKMDSTILQPPPKNHLIACSCSAKATSDKMVMTDESAGIVQLRDSSDNWVVQSREDYENRIAKYERAPWSSGSGDIKEYALDTAKIRIKVLDGEIDQLRQDKNHFLEKARKWKTEAGYYQRKLEKLQQKEMVSSGNDSKSLSCQQTMPERCTQVLGEYSPNLTEKTGPPRKKSSDDDFANFKLEFPKCDMSQFRKPFLENAQNTPKMTETASPKPSKRKKRIATPSKENCKQQ